jgi:hypothetical protein
MMELTEEQEQGIKMLSKILTKQYPFIIDASPNITDFEQYDTLITIKIIVSKLKLEDYFMKRVHYDWNEFWRFSNIIYPNPDPEDLISKEIKSLCEMFYESITDEYQFKSGLSTQPFRRVKISSFLLQ